MGSDVNLFISNRQKISRLIFFYLFTKLARLIVQTTNQFIYFNKTKKEIDQSLDDWQSAAEAQRM